MKSVTTFDAKNRLSELIVATRSGKRHLITKNGVEAAVLLSYEDYRKLVAREKPLVDFLLESSLLGSDIDLERSKADFGRPTIDFDSEEYR